jgi:hypothetical protein
MYAARPPSASIATGNKRQHKQEEFSFLSKALLGVTRPEPKDIESGVPIWDDSQKEKDPKDMEEAPIPPQKIETSTPQSSSNNSAPSTGDTKEEVLEAEAMGASVDAIPKESAEDNNDQSNQSSKGFFGWLSGKK